MNLIPTLSPGMIVELRDGRRGQILSIIRYSFHAVNVTIMFADHVAEIRMDDKRLKRIFDEENETVWEAAA